MNICAVSFSNALILDAPVLHATAGSLVIILALPDAIFVIDVGYHKIAIAQPSHAPYGERAKQSLQTAGVWSQLAPKLVFGENIAQTAQLAQSGAADVAIIALSLVKNPHLAASATNNNHAEHYQLLDEATYQPLLQTYTLTHSGAQKPRALQLLKFMQSQQAQQILLHYGFELPKPDLTQ